MNTETVAENALRAEEERIFKLFMEGEQGEDVLADMKAWARRMVRMGLKPRNVWTMVMRYRGQVRPRIG